MNKAPHLHVVGGSERAKSGRRETQREQLARFEQQLDPDAPMVLLGLDKETGGLLMRARMQDTQELLSLLNGAIAAAVLDEAQRADEGDD